MFNVYSLVQLPDNTPIICIICIMTKYTFNIIQCTMHHECCTGRMRERSEGEGVTRYCL